MVQNNDSETIVAQATPAGFGGIGIVRVSGPAVVTIAKALLSKIPYPKQAEYLRFCDRNGQAIDEGIALYFKAPHSFTGEDVLELQGHGGPIVMQCLMREILALGARMARPGEFSERAFLNNKLDLVQAEAILDLIHANSEQAARSAVRSLQGEFSNEIYILLEEFIQLRMHVEAQIDFPDEEITTHAHNKMQALISVLDERIAKILKKAKTGALMSEGANVLILGRPNAGKSSLLNVLSGYEAAIVTDIPGTTRDLLKEKINLDGLLLHLVDTAGLRESTDIVEQEGIKRAIGELKKADHLLLVVDALNTTETDPKVLFPEWTALMKTEIPITVLYNKIDVLNVLPKIEKKSNYTLIYASMKTKAGIDLLRDHLKNCFQFSLGLEGTFAARTRHVKALEACKLNLMLARQHLENEGVYELMAEELRLGQKHLDDVTGKFTSDDLLGKIFSEFCIGK